MTKPSEHPDPGATLIALNASYLSRAALCRLAVDPGLWSSTPEDQVEARALALGVPAQQLRKGLRALDRAEATAARERRRAEESGYRILTRLDDAYPTALLDHPLPPPVLYCRGNLPAGPAVSIVGSRRMDSYGRDATRLFARGLARAGVTVVSGFALGVDQAAHRACLDAGGKTVAVLGCGLDIDYPAGSRGLADAIAQSGALISELPPGTEPRAWHFPIRNRMIAALGAGTLVVQAKIRSGSLITAHQALEMGRDVFAVPGRVTDELSLGPNGLLADGAAVVQCVEDVLEHLSLGWQRDLFPEPGGATSARRVEPPKPDGLAGEVLDTLDRGHPGRTAEEISKRVGQSVDAVLGVLLELELSGWIERRPGPVYGR
ncbi:MAG: DNA-processing protein DprA [Acidobacteriota bacterium]